ncbi:MAG: AMP-binding protein, partial [Gammaproteobacteria bacterium]
MQKTWLNNYAPGMPTEINPDAYASLVEIFLESVHKYSNKPAITNLGCQLTYSEWFEKSRIFAAYLQEDCGLKKGDRFAIMLPNLLQYPVALFGALMAGLT